MLTVACVFLGLEWAARSCTPVRSLCPQALLAHAVERRAMVGSSTGLLSSTPLRAPPPAPFELGFDLWEDFPRQ